MKKRVITVFTAILLILSTVTACDGSDKPTPTEEQRTSSKTVESTAEETTTEAETVKSVKISDIFEIEFSYENENENSYNNGNSAYKRGITITSKDYKKISENYVTFTCDEFPDAKSDKGAPSFIQYDVFQLQNEQKITLRISLEENSVKSLKENNLVLESDSEEITVVGLPEFVTLLGRDLRKDLTALSLFANNGYDYKTPFKGFTSEDLEPLREMTDLKELRIYYFRDDNEITHINFLEGLTNLEILFLSYSGITDISPLAGLTNLKELHLDNNSITDLSPLAGLTSLKELYFDSNPVTDYNNVEVLKGLTNLELLVVNLDFYKSYKDELQTALPDCAIRY
jgi:Leucine-rich repeat (LRR) protein